MYVSIYYTNLCNMCLYYMYTSRCPLIFYSNYIFMRGLPIIHICQLQMCCVHFLHNVAACVLLQVINLPELNMVTHFTHVLFCKFHSPLAHEISNHISTLTNAIWCIWFWKWWGQVHSHTLAIQCVLYLQSKFQIKLFHKTCYKFL